MIYWVRNKKAEYYQGQWRANQKDGLGEYHYLNGDKYEGEFQTGKYHGNVGLLGNLLLSEWRHFIRQLVSRYSPRNR